MQRLRGPSDGEGRVTRKGSFRKAPRVGAAKASGTEEVVTPTKSTRRDEREILVSVTFCLPHALVVYV